MRTACPSVFSVRVLSGLCRTVALGAALLAPARSMAQGPAQQTGNGEIRIAFAGDSMADGIWGGLVRATSNDTCLKGHFTLGRFGENGTGLTRADKFNWAEETKKIIASFSPALVIVSFGLNDRQGVVEPDRVTRVELGGAEWPRRYSSHITSVLAEASVGKAGLLWVGLPVLRDKVSQTDAQEKTACISKTCRISIRRRCALSSPGVLPRKAMMCSSPSAPARVAKLSLCAQLTAFILLLPAMIRLLPIFCHVLLRILKASRSQLRIPARNNRRDFKQGRLISWQAHGGSLHSLPWPASPVL